MHMMKLNFNGFRVTYGKSRNGPYSARIYSGNENGAYFTPIKWIVDCETKEEILINIGFEICDLVKQEVDPTVPYQGDTQVIGHLKGAL